MKLLALLILSSLLAFSCTDLKKGSQLDAINVLSVQLDSLDGELASHKMDSGFYFAQLASAVELRIKTFYFADTIDMKLGMKMDAYKLMRKKLEPLAGDYNNLKLGVLETKSSVANLKDDIENGNGKREKYDEFVVFEANKVEQLNVLYKDYFMSRDKTLATYNELHSELDAFSMELQEKAKNNIK
ncbi:MAG: hypothetical protein ACI9XP_001139 [Lentimonas sp.]|jgi:hypothetical protein